MNQIDESHRSLIGSTGDVFNALSDHTAVLDLLGVIVRVNAAWQQFLGENAAGSSGVGRAYLEFCKSKSAIPLPNAAKVREGLQSVISGSVPLFSLSYQGVGGAFLMRAVPLPSGQGVLVTHTKMSEPTCLELETCESWTLLQLLMNGSSDGVLFAYGDGCVFLVNTALAEITGRSVKQLVGQKVKQVLGPEIASFVFDETPKNGVGSFAKTIEFELESKKQPRTVRVFRGMRTGRFLGKVYAVILRDVSQIKEMEREVINTSDKEKERFGYELHENLCQSLVGISLLGNVLDEELLRMGLKQAADARQIGNMAKEAVVEVRALIKQLSPMPAEAEVGLGTALEELADYVTSVGKIECKLSLPRWGDEVDSGLGIQLYKIAQEAVHNAIKHSRAGEITIKLSRSRQAMLLSVEDNGIGFSKRGDLETSHEGLGLHIMGYRSRAIGAKLDIRLLANGGTAVVCTIPRK